jgi:two-component system, LytTR family, sensor histidine kinase LytS
VFSIKSRNAAKIESSSKEFHFMIGKPLHKKTWFILSVFGGIIFIISITIIFYYQRKQKENKAKIEKLTLENHLILLEQKALQLQMNPHFIFNVLNGIKALGNSGNSTELNKTVSQFATLLRSILQNSRKEEISLSEEINTIKNYLELEQRMSSNAFEYVIETATKNTDVDEILIPPMLLQPFVENSIKHGFKGISYVGKIAILFEIKRPFLHCIISDNGIGFNHSKSAENHDSIALKVTKERIGSLSKYSTLDISEIKENDVVKGTKVEFKIPLKTDY